MSSIVEFYVFYKAFPFFQRILNFSKARIDILTHLFKIPGRLRLILKKTFYFLIQWEKFVSISKNKPIKYEYVHILFYDFVAELLPFFS